MELHWTTQSSYPILALLQLVPLLGIAWVWLFSKSKLLLSGTIIIAIIEFLLAIQLYHLFDQSQPSSSLPNNSRSWAHYIIMPPLMAWPCCLSC